MSLRVLVKAPLNPYSGYGKDGLGIIKALLAMGIDVSVHPTHITPPIDPVVASLLTKRLEAPFDLLIHHVDPAQLGLSPPERRGAAVTVAWTMWEYSTLDNLKLPIQDGRRVGTRKRLADYDAVLGYDSVSAGALEPFVGKKTALSVVQGGYWPEEWPAVARDWHGPRFGFFLEGQLHQRKDPFVAIEAFRELKEDKGPDFDGAELHLKTSVTGLHPAMEDWIPKLRVHYSVWPIEVLREFYAAQHVLLAPSRGEGKNMPALQFMSSGGPVIATNWGGHTQWLRSEIGYPLDFELAPVSASQPNCLNARASKEHLKSLMWHAYTHREEVARKGATAAQLIPEMCGWVTVMDRFFLRLAEMLPDQGPALLAAARTATPPVASLQPPMSGAFRG